MFSGKGLSVRPLEMTKQILVDDIHNYNEEYLQLYFENEGEDVENIKLNEVEQSAVITFKDCRGNSLTLYFRYYCKCTMYVLIINSKVFYSHRYEKNHEEEALHQE